MDAPLSGKMVLDLTLARAGPTATRQLADWGADVVRIEAPGGQDQADVVSSGRDSGDYQNLHRNKRSVSVNLKSPAGLAVFDRLVERADVLVENFRPDVKRRLRIDYDRLNTINPRLVYASISGFGESGPYRDRPGVDQIIQGMSGLMSITGEPESSPTRAGIAISDTSAGLFCAFGIVLALLARTSTGKGQWVSTSLLHSMMFMLDFQAARWLIDGQVPARAGNNHPTASPMGVFPASDQVINIAASGQRLWRRFCDCVGRTDLYDDPRFSTSEARRHNRDELNAEISEITRQKPAADWIELLNGAGIPAGPINTIDQAFADPQVQYLDLVREVAGTGPNALRFVEQPVRLAEMPSGILTAAAAHGEHTEAVLTDLGYAPDEIRALRTNGVVE